MKNQILKFVSEYERPLVAITLYPTSMSISIYIVYHGFLALKNLIYGGAIP